MKRFLMVFAMFFIIFAARAADTCQQCMARCPHATREIRDCDRGCPEVCKKNEVAAIKKVRSCQSCISECPHVTRDLKPCDMGCKEDCDRDSLYELLQKNIGKKGCGLGDSAPAARGGFHMSAPDVDDGWDMGGGATAR